MTGILTKQKVVGTAIYVDRASNLSYICHHTALNSEETVKEKKLLKYLPRHLGLPLSTIMQIMVDLKTKHSWNQ
jgi:hypothetical protein